MDSFSVRRVPQIQTVKLKIKMLKYELYAIICKKKETLQWRLRNLSAPSTSSLVSSIDIWMSLKIELKLAGSSVESSACFRFLTRSWNEVFGCNRGSYSSWTWLLLTWPKGVLESAPFWWQLHCSHWDLSWHFGWTTCHVILVHKINDSVATLATQFGDFITYQAPTVFMKKIK